MNRILKYLICALLMLTTLNAVAQNDDKAERKKAREELRESLRATKATPKKSGPIEIPENPDDGFVVPQNAPYMDSKEQKLYHIRNVNIHGVKYLNHDILRSASGLIPGDSVYLPGPFLQRRFAAFWIDGPGRYTESPGIRPDAARGMPQTAFGCSATLRIFKSVQPLRATASTWRLSSRSVPV